MAIESRDTHLTRVILVDDLSLICASTAAHDCVGSGEQCKIFAKYVLVSVATKLQV